MTPQLLVAGAKAMVAGAKATSANGVEITEASLQAVSNDAMGRQDTIGMHRVGLRQKVG